MVAYNEWRLSEGWCVFLDLEDTLIFALQPGPAIKRWNRLVSRVQPSCFSNISLFLAWRCVQALQIYPMDNRNAGRDIWARTCHRSDLSPGKSNTSPLPLSYIYFVFCSWLLKSSWAGKWKGEALARSWSFLETSKSHTPHSVYCDVKALYGIKYWALMRCFCFQSNA